jgi:hypothetical protein
MGLVRLTVVLRAPTARAAREVLETLQFLLVPTRLDPACVAGGVRLESDCILRYEEQWEETDMRRRILSPSFTSLLAALECPLERPDVVFDFGGWTRGIDFIREVREEGLDEEK